VAIEVCLSFNFPVDFNFNVFPFPPSKSKLIGDVLMNRQNGATCYIVFFSLLQRALPIDATNHPALLGDARGEQEKNPRNQIWKLCTQQIRTALPASIY
jgi:hypothetical protein